MDQNLTTTNHSCDAREAALPLNPLIMSAKLPPLHPPSTRRPEIDNFRRPDFTSYCRPLKFGPDGMGDSSATYVNIAADRASGSNASGAQEITEDELATLRRYDTVILLDDSTSMGCGNRWGEAKHALSKLADVAVKYDKDGIDIHFLNCRKTGKNLKSARAVEQCFMGVGLSGSTPIGARLNDLIRAYWNDLEKARAEAGKSKRDLIDYIKPMNYIVITDGCPTDAPEDVIVYYAQKLDQYDYPLDQIGVQLIQIGNSNSAATYLAKLDDSLAQTYKIRDMVDTTSCNSTKGYLTSDTIVKSLLGGINRRVDRSGRN
ncbi:unnamed protein product [Somion occarium]|uniref:VWFA domain-containing protein n=2 Tax=Somion occarium TaxID=3059160 RepID=A0ABP1CX99_9APHY